MKKLFCLLAFICVLQTPARAEDVHVVVSGGLATAYKQLAPGFETNTRARLITEWGPSLGTTPGAIPMRLDRGEPVDVVVMVRDGVPALIAKGQIVAGSVVDIARSKIAMAVKQGAPAPDISSVDAFKRALLNARSVAYSDSASGVYIQNEMFKRLGIEQQMAAKSRMIPATPVGEAVARGEFELGFQQYSELLAVSGVRVVGLIPDEVQKITVYSAAVATKAKAPAAGRALIQYLASPAAAGAIRDSGLEPIVQP